jgi:formyl-CoA transferase
VQAYPDHHLLVPLVQVIDAWVASHTAAEVMAAMNEARVPAGPILSTADIATDPQYQARGMLERASPPAGAGVLRVRRR